MTITKNKILDYGNGNTHVTIYDDGTKVREGFGEKLHPIAPESIDIKITDFCDAGCPWCHEQSTLKGIHANKYKVMSFFRSLPYGTELAIGGGNPLSHPDIFEILDCAKSKNLISNITVNSIHLKRHWDDIEKLRKEKLIYGLGVSYNPKYKENIKAIADKNTVIHLIAGINTPSEAYDFINYKMLILGYKTFGYGVRYESLYPDKVKENLQKWKYWIGTLLRNTKSHISFDNRALDQLNIKSWIEESAWKEYYMGDDGTFTMYVDLVKEEYAKTSTSERKNINNLDIFEMFKNIRKENK